MKKFLSLYLALGMGLNLVSCSSGDDTSSQSGNSPADGTTATESSNTESSKVQPLIINYHENWDFSGGFSPLPVEGHSTGTFGVRVFYRICMKL